MAGTLHNGVWVRTDRDWIRFDASQTMELYASPNRLLWGAAVALIVLGVIVWGVADDATPPTIYLYAWVGVIGCVLVLVLIFVRVLAIRRPVIRLSSDGFLDVRISSTVVPWSLIREISVGTIRGSSYHPDRPALFLYLPASSWQNLPLKPLARWSLPVVLKRARGHEGLCIGDGYEFGMSFDTFRDVVTAYAEAQGVTVN
jgi:hypothetical protein